MSTSFISLCPTIPCVSLSPPLDHTAVSLCSSHSPYLLISLQTYVFLSSLLDCKAVSSPFIHSSYSKEEWIHFELN
jgi:hypothetical protein